MEEKPLNLNQPFLSVRRPTPTSVRTKNHRRISNPQSQKSGPLRNPGAVPFIWEQSPGQPKEASNPQTQNSDKPPLPPKLPPGRHPDITNKSLDERSSKKEESESGDEAYVDALDTLSRAESSFLNCSVSSGVSDLEHVKPSTEFMMDRFLPAAKAMASETTPQFVPKKQLLQPKKEVNQHKALLRYGPSFADRYSYSQDNNSNKEEEEEEEESDDEYDEGQNVSAICGLLPRFCLKSSLGLLSPVPAMSVRTRSSAKKVERRSSPPGPYNKIDNKSRPDRAEIKAIDKIQATEVDQEYAKSRNKSGHVPSLNASLEDKEALSNAEEKTSFKTFQELLNNRASLEESSVGDPIIEKTLYVDTVHKVESPGLWSRDEDCEITTKRIDQTSIVDSSLEDLKKLLPNDQDFGKQLSKAVTVEKCSYQNRSGLIAPPPLPKSPSDSWLWRTLPSTRSSSLRSYIDSNHEKQLKMGPTSDHKKWETIVKATNVKHHHLHYSEEMLTTIPES